MPTPAHSDLTATTLAEVVDLALEHLPGKERPLLIDPPPELVESVCGSERPLVGEVRELLEPLAGGTPVAMSTPTDLLILQPLAELLANQQRTTAFAEALASSLATESRAVVLEPPDPQPARTLRAALAAAGTRIQKAIPLRPNDRTGDPQPRVLMLRFDGYPVRDFEPGDEHSLSELFESSFHHQRPLAHWTWKYRENPWGQERISVVLDQESRVVGQYCAYPVPFVRRLSGRLESFLAHQVGDTMTAPAVRAVGRGPTSLLARAAHHFYDRHCHDGVAFNYGFNTGNIFKFSRRYVGALEVMPVPYRVRSTAAVRQSGSRSLLRRMREPIRVEVLRSGDIIGPDLAAELDRLMNRATLDEGLMVERTSSYLQWRYLARPDADYRLLLAWSRKKLLGWSVFRRANPSEVHHAGTESVASTLLWGDALWPSSGIRADLRRIGCSRTLDAAQEAFQATRVVGWFEGSSQWKRLLDDLGFEGRSEPNGLTMVVVPFAWSDPTSALQTGYLTMGDGDLF